MTVIDVGHSSELLIDYFNGDELAANTFLNKYALRDEDGNLLEHHPDEMHMRLSREFARIERKYKNPYSKDEIYDLLKDFKYLVPQGSPMFGIGNKHQVISLSNCFVIGNGADSYGGITMVDEEQIQLMKRRGGVGHDLSHIRPNKTKVHNSAMTSTGLKPFMQRFSNSTREVAQGGRRGALMLTLDIRHPDVESFIDAKMNKIDITGANISLKLSDEFMRAVDANKTFKLQYPVESENPKIELDIDAKSLWDHIINNVWSSAEPGIFFWDKVLSESPADMYAEEGFRTISSNPCGELPLCPYDSCRLLAINLSSYVENEFTEDASFDFDLLAEHTKIGQRLLDDMIDLEIEKINAILRKISSDPENNSIKRVERELWQKIKEKAIQGRRTGLGVTAEGDMLAYMNMQYGSDEAIKFSEQVHKLIAVSSYVSSIELAKERGSFPIWDYDTEKENDFLKRIDMNLSMQQRKDYKRYGRRNIANLTLAPTGTVSMMTQTTSGIEPVFLIQYTRRKKVNPNEIATSDFVDDLGDAWTEHTVFHNGFKRWMNINGIFGELNDEEIEKFVKESPYYKATSNDINWVQKVKMQGVIQKWIDHSISVTVNVPQDTKKSTVNEVYMTAWKAGCKGVTLYREGSRSGVLIAKEKKEEEKFEKMAAVERPKTLECDIHHRIATGEAWLVIVGKLLDKPYEIFAFRKWTEDEESEDKFNLPRYIKLGRLEKRSHGKYDLICGKNDNFIVKDITNLFKSEEEEALTRLISSALRHRMGVEYIVDQLNKVPSNITSFSKVVARTLKQYITEDIELINKTCTECEDPDGLIIQDGCLSCKSCGFSKCG